MSSLEQDNDADSRAESVHMLKEYIQTLTAEIEKKEQ